MQDITPLSLYIRKERDTIIFQESIDKDILLCYYWFIG